ncbi:MAG: repressor LexA [Acidobacteria bacterium]|nr:repressor LexA [Acidobacteriota bacterium]NIQ84714.1 repressor LexA [Acidobacteriota bacterium]
MGRTPAGETRERIFGFVRERLLAGQPPTTREVQQAFGFKAVQSARAHLETLVEEGRLAKQPGKARGYRLPRRGAAPTVLVPVLGRVPAGSLEAAVEDLDGYVPFQSRRSPGKLFGLRVKGESMLDAGILPGDLVIVRKQADADSGQIIVALVEDEATVKTLRKRRNRIELHPANPRYPILLPDPHEVRILGKVIEVRRTLDT